MKTRRSHYEIAFESLMERRGTPCVAVEDVKHFAKAKTGAKIFDFIVYPPGHPAYLIDVKGRKSRAGGSAGDCRQKTWVTRGDIEGLKLWQNAFGEEFRSAFVFVYWLAGRKNGSETKSYRDDVDDRLGGQATFRLAGRDYSFWVVPAAEYAKHAKQLSKRWDTVSIPRDIFREISSPLETTWPSAPC